MHKQLYEISLILYAFFIFAVTVIHLDTYFAIVCNESDVEILY